jgi:hypothetical protein
MSADPIARESPSDPLTRAIGNLSTSIGARKEPV